MALSKLVLLLTEQCNAECDICALSCSPKTKTIMELEQAYNYIEQAAKIHDFEYVCISGGEPFLYYDHLIKLIKKANGLNFKVAVTTNGFWGRTKENSEKIVKSLIDAGLTRMDLSVDEFHSKYIPYDYVKNILSASHKFNLNIEISSVVTKKSHRLKDIKGILNEHLSNFTIIERPCSPVGRAAQKINKQDLIYKKSACTQRCFNQTSLLIFPDGRTFPCCCPTEYDGLLYLGSAEKMTINEIIKKYNSNIYCKMLKTYGVGWFVNIIKEHNIPISLEDNHVEICHVCSELFLNKEYDKYYRPYLEKEKLEIYEKIKKKLI